MELHAIKGTLRDKNGYERQISGTAFIVEMLSVNDVEGVLFLTRHCRNIHVWVSRRNLITRKNTCTCNWFQTGIIVYCMVSKCKTNLFYDDITTVSIEMVKSTIMCWLTNVVQDKPIQFGPLSVASFTKEINPRLAKRQLVFNGRLANCGFTSLVKEATVRRHNYYV